MYQSIKYDKMKRIYKIPVLLAFLAIGIMIACDDDDNAPGTMNVMANAGPDQTVEPTDMVSMDGTGSTVSGGGSISYSWMLTAAPDGSAAALTGENTATPTLTTDLEGDYELTLTVSNGTEMATDMVIVSAIEPQFSQSDQMARPAINTVFVMMGSKDDFNVTIPSDMGAVFAGPFETRLLALNPDYTVNVLGWDAATMAGALATDVLNSDLTTPTAFGSLNGRALDDDVITTELTLIFGGPLGLDKPTLSDDNVDSNDKAFLNNFPYLAEPH